MIIPDTDVTSVVTRETPDERVVAWLGPQKSLILSVPTIVIGGSSVE